MKFTGGYRGPRWFGRTIAFALLFTLVVAGCNDRGDVSLSDPGAGARDASVVDVKPERDRDADPTLPSIDVPIVKPPGPVTDAYVGGCGDKLQQTGEACDDGNSLGGDGCSVDCKQIEQDWGCPVLGAACVFLPKCGDGKVGGKETCDDGNVKAVDGCSATCQLEPGWICARAGDPCQSKACGDGIVAGTEQCDDGQAVPAAGDGCSATCKLEKGFACDVAGQLCRATVCNDGKREGLEPCDDGNQVVGDGCTPFCELEPDCSAGACKSRCGDGLILASDMEECDDGNTRDGDGCSAACKVEKGFSCQATAGQFPDDLSIPVTYRDFIAFPTGGKTRHPDFQAAFAGNSVTPNLVKPTLDAMGKPIFNGLCTSAGVTVACPYNQQMTTSTNFDQWYRDVPGVNLSKVERLALKRQPSGAYFFPPDGNEALQLFPFDAGGWVAAGGELASDDAGNLPAKHNFGFTSEVRYYFTFSGGEVLNFSGDDDVWVFINRRLALDLGGVHKRVERSVTLDTAKATELGLEKGKVYEFVLFHAERHTQKSNFNLTLNGFVTAETTCANKCGDGIVAGDETCDDGKNDNSYGSCTPQCRLGPRCGDAVKQEVEACDDGVNLTPYKADGSGCAPGCKKSAFCGDGKVEGSFGEQCDEGPGGNLGGYGKCKSDCKPDARCGDGVVQTAAGEDCDDGNTVSGDGCQSDCKSIL